MVSKRSLDIPPFLVMDVLEKAQEMERRGEHIIHLEVGEPDFETPKCIREACAKALQEGKTKYTHSLGLLELREAIGEYYAKDYGTPISPHQIVITMGSSPAMFLLFSALLEAGDEVIVSNPYYACYPNIIRFLGVRCTMYMSARKLDFNISRKKYPPASVPEQKPFSSILLPTPPAALFPLKYCTR